jgi:8-oxo-dGTP pyrophosphatase MutT (NUDIX family)
MSREGYDNCAVRELQEEIGLAIQTPLQRSLQAECRPGTDWEHVWVYRCEAEVLLA